MGFHLEFVKGEGPMIDNPFRTAADLARMRKLDAGSDLGSVMDAIRIVRGELPEETALIGFCGAPFTVASYMIEGGPSREYRHTKTLMYSDPQTWDRFMGRIAEAMADYLVAQIQAGAQAVQLFDSWVGVLSPADFRRYVLPYSQKVLQAAGAQGVPTIHFGTGTSTLLPLMKQAGSDVLGLDWRTPLDEGWSQIGQDVAVQGNLDPMALFAPLDVLQGQVQDVLKRAAGRPGHIFNLGHGISKHTDPARVKAVVDMVHEGTAK
jgi:uroporphyrinogen decarboxylase